MTISRKLILAAGCVGFGGAAQAGLEVCNETEFVQSVSLGFEGASGWTSKGWWNIEPRDCAIVVGGELPKRYYYIRAEVDGGDFAGEGYMFCTTPKEYEIVGDTDCESRGFESESFREIDTGETATDYTYTLVGDSGVVPPPNDDNSGPGETAELGLTICNQTRDPQSISIGYENDQGFISEGWWNIEPDDCAKVLGGKLTQRYYYYRAEVKAGPFEGEGYMFCTTPEVYSIQGDNDCEARGYDTESFSEIDTGLAAQGFTFYVTAEGNAPPPPANDPPPPPVNDPPPVVTSTGAGLEICNETSYKQSVTIGFEGAEDWVSMGWWNIEPGDCTRPRLDEVNHRFIYYRAESGGGVLGGDFYFCTVLEPFEIVGDGNCEARGYIRKAYAEVDTGSTTDPYTLTLLQSDLSTEPEVTPEDDRPDTPPVADDGVDTVTDTPIFDFDLPDEEPETPDPDVSTLPNPELLPDTGTPDDVATPIDEPPFVDDAPAEDVPPVTDDTVVVEDPPQFDDFDEDAQDELFPVEDEEDEEDRPAPVRRGGSRGG